MRLEYTGIIKISDYINTKTINNKANKKFTIQIDFSLNLFI